MEIDATNSFKKVTNQYHKYVYNIYLYILIYTLTQIKLSILPTCQPDVKRNTFSIHPSLAITYNIHFYLLCEGIY